MAAPPGWPYSPDGRFWWDGAAWQPVQPPPPGSPAQQGLGVPPGFQEQQSPGVPPSPGPAARQGFAVPPPPGSPGRRGVTVPPPPGPATAGHPSIASPWPQPPGPQAAQPYAVGQGQPYAPPDAAAPTPPGVAPQGRRRGTAVFVLAAAGTLIAALALGAVTGAAIGLATTEPVTDASAPSFPARFPTAKQRYLPKVTVDMVAVKWLQAADAWTCAKSAAPDPLTGAKMGMICRPGDAARRQMSVFIWYDGPGKVVSVKADCKLGAGTKACTSLFAKMAGTLLSPSRSLRAKAETWAGENADRAAVTAIGGVRLETRPRPHSMEAVPAI